MEAVAEMREKIAAVLDNPDDGDHASGMFARVDVELPRETDPLTWLACQQDVTRYYWRDRTGAFTMAGVSEADVLVPSGETDLRGLFNHMRSRMQMRYPSQRYYGGFRFHQGPVRGDRWSKFSAYRFILPAFEVMARSDRVFLVCNIKVAHPDTNARTKEQLIELLGQLRFDEDPPAPSIPGIEDRVDTPDFDRWKQLTEEALEACAQHDLEKVVLARESAFKAKEDFDPISVLRRLSEHSVHAFEFCFQPVLHRAFLGASPERLYKRVNCLIESEALAGTRPRGKTDAEDEEFAEALLKSDKDLREHRFVVRMLRENLQRYCRHLEAEDEPALVRLRNCHHLCTRFEGILDDVDIDAALIGALHPTPAVGGVPRDKALEWLEQAEPFDRGVYAAPVGWVSFDAAEFSVGIRTGLIIRNELTVYSGAGIVPGSVPEEEWAEVENKMANFISVLNNAYC
jgi:menaquinone-specific isochorismate synthase